MILSGSVTIYTSEKGIKRTERYWLASALSEGVTVETAGWTTEVQTATAEKPYLWTYEKIVYTDDTYEVFGPVVNSVRGAQGWKGALPRIGKWESGGTYYQGGEGEEFYDIKLYNGKYYLCKGSHTGHTTTPDQDTGYWIEATNEWKFIATDLIKADKGVVENLNANYITMTDESGQIIFCAKDGEVTCNKGTFKNVDVTGTITANRGTIAGFNVSGNTLTNEGLNNDASILFRNTNVNTYAGIGGNVLALSTGLRAIARFDNNEDKMSAQQSTPNYALLVKASGALDNIALEFMGGCVVGFAMHNTTIGVGKTAVTLEREDYNVVCLNSATCTITLPTMNVEDDGHVIRFKRIGDANIKLKMSNCYTRNGFTKRYSTPVIIYDRGSCITGTNTLTTLDSEMDSFELVWVRDISKTINGTTYYGAWIEYKLPRDW